MYGGIKARVLRRNLYAVGDQRIRKNWIRFAASILNFISEKQAPFTKLYLPSLPHNKTWCERFICGTNPVTHSNFIT